MALQVRITDPDGSNPVVLDAATGKRVSFSLNSEDEGGKFTIAKNHPKADILNPDTTGYTKLWEIWDTATNERLNFGPIDSIAEKGTNWEISGKGRASLFADFIDTRKTFYAPIDDFIDTLRFENISIEPKSSTVIHTASPSADQTTVFGSITIDEKYHGLSGNTKDNIIDGQTRFRPGEIEPPNTYYSVDSFWAGMSKNDAIIVDLGDIYPIDRIDLLFPWWGGVERHNNRGFDFTLAYATDTEAPLTTLKDRSFGPFHTLFSTGTNSSRVDRPYRFNLGLSNEDTRLGVFAEDVALSSPGPVDMRYLRVNISNTHAWYGAQWGLDNTVEDRWAYQCDEDYSGGLSEDIPIKDRELKPNNDCYASILELGAYKEIIGRDRIKPLALQRIDNNNLQISYSHTPQASEITTTDAGFRKFEPGGFFRKFRVTYSGASTNYTKFFTSDCTNCYPDGFHFGVSDQNNTLIYSTDNTSDSNHTVKAPIMTKSILMKGASNATVDWVDTWPTKYDPISWGTSYSVSQVDGDYAVLQFRGQSLKWYSTVPAGKTPATCRLELRSKTGTGGFTSWTTLDANFIPPNGPYSAQVVYEITYESGTLLADTTYEFKITNIDDGWLSIDSFEGFWSASMAAYNDDSSRIFHWHPEKMTQIYDGRFMNGTMTKWNSHNYVDFHFEGDRVILLSAKGRHHALASVYLYDGDGAIYYGKTAAGNAVVPIPGGEVDGGLQIDLDTGKRGAEIPQYVLFDSNDYFPDGLPWGKYTVFCLLRKGDEEEYLANVYDTNNFVARCEDCKTPKGTQEINKYMYFDSLMVHEKVGLSVTFETKTHLEMLKSVAEAIQSEWDITDDGVVLDPRIGQDTDIILREGQNVLVDYNIVNDVSKVASMLFSSGGDIDGLPLTTITEDRVNKETLGRTVMREHDFRESVSYLQLIGLSRMELRKRRYPEKRITVKYISNEFGLRKGDSFILYTKKMGPLRVRIDHMDITEDSGREYSLECIRWPILS